MPELRKSRQGVLDTTILVATPENVAFDFRLAGPFTRAAALLVDLVLMAFLFFMLAFFTGLLGTAFVGVLLFMAFAIWWGYGGLMEAFNNGQTLGKKAMGLRVVSQNGLAINGGQAMLRNILRMGDLFPPFFPGIVCMLFNSRFQRLGDLATGTVVVLDGARVSPRLHESGAISEELRELIPPRYRPDAAMIDVLTAYVGRRAEFTPGRRRELAGHLSRHFIRSWSLPPGSDPDVVLCTVYVQVVAKEDGAFIVQKRKNAGSIYESEPEPVNEFDQALDAIASDWNRQRRRLP